MKIFGWTIKRTSEVFARDMRWFARGFDTGWAEATNNAVKTFNQHGFTVLAMDSELIKKLKLDELKKLTE